MTSPPFTFLGLSGFWSLPLPDSLDWKFDSLELSTLRDCLLFFMSVAALSMLPIIPFESTEFGQNIGSSLLSENEEWIFSPQHLLADHIVPGWQLSAREAWPACVTPLSHVKKEPLASLQRVCCCKKEKNYTSLSCIAFFFYMQFADNGKILIELDSSKKVLRNFIYYRPIMWRLNPIEISSKIALQQNKVASLFALIFMELRLDSLRVEWLCWPTSAKLTKILDKSLYWLSSICTWNNCVFVCFFFFLKERLWMTAVMN